MSRKRGVFDFSGVVRITKLGTGFLAFTFVIGFAALNTGNNSLYVILAFMLGTLIISGLISKRGLGMTSVTLRAPGELWATRSALGTLVVENGSRWLSVRDLVLVLPEISSPVMISLVPGGAKVSAAVRMTFPKRGRVSMNRVDLYTRFPLGLFTKKRRVRVDADALVYPRIDLEEGARSRPQEGGDVAPLNKPGSGLEAFGFRDYQSGESIRSIHWKRSVSTGRWIVRQGTEEASDHVAIVLDTFVPQPGGSIEFERLVSSVAAATLEAHQAGKVVTLHLPGVALSTQQGVKRLFGALALVEPSEDGVPPIVPRGAMVFSLRWGANERRETV